MPEPNQNIPATVPEQPESKPPLKKSMPVVIALVVILGLIGIANLSSLLSGNRKNAPASSMPTRPAAPNAQQVNSFESQQQLQAQRDTEARQHQQELNAALQQLQQTEGAPGPEAAGAPPMTAAQRASIYGDNGISEESAMEGEQVLNHFLNRLPIITLKEGSRARVYIGTDLLIPAYAEHRVDPTL